MNEVAGGLDAEVGRRPGADGSLTSQFPEGMTRSGMLTWEKDHRIVAIAFDQGRVTLVVEQPLERPARERSDIEYTDE